MAFGAFVFHDGEHFAIDFGPFTTSTTVHVVVSFTFGTYTFSVCETMIHWDTGAMVTRILVVIPRFAFSTI
jgi:hypothetical protein